VGTLLHDRPVICSSTEVSRFAPPSGQTCGQYLNTFLQTAPGVLQNPDSTYECYYCSLRSSDQFLAGSEIYYSQRWRNYGIMWAFICFNIFMAILTYYLFRVAKFSKGESGGKSKGKKGAEKVAEKSANEGATPPSRNGQT
jgi:ATP-binding cassette subfamily G (WHITE) protein 2 (PDR)